jgi:hypothetical protein
MAQFLTEYRITMAATWAQDNPHMSDPIAGASHWRCTFKRGRQRLTVPFSMGPAHRGEPEARDVLSCLADDAAGYENAPDFESWAPDYGYDTDSRRALKTFATVEKQSAKLKAFLGDEAYEQLLWKTERE